MDSAEQTAVPRTRLATIRDRYLAYITLNTNGLPRVRVLLAFPALLLLLGVALVGLGLNGSSSGALYNTVYSGHDPALIAGNPEAIRSDEWNVGTVWSIAQVEQGLPARSQTFPGGMDAAVPYDLPRLDWSIAFRPHQLGYLIMDVDHATAWRWWASGLALIAAAYLFLVTIIPRRPGIAAALSVGFFFSPFFQWWYQSTTFSPITWGLITMASLAWALKTTSERSRWIWAAVVSYQTIVMAMGIYAPFIVPVVLVVIAFGLSLAVDHRKHSLSWLDLLKRLLPTLAAALVAVAVTGAWLVSKSATVAQFLETVYPGQRLTPAGSGTVISFARTISSSFAQSLKSSGGFLGINSSEASTFFLIGAFLIPIVGWAIYRQVKLRATLPWVLIGLVVVMLLFIAFFFVPGWDPIAHLLFLDRSTADRTRIGIGLASFAILAYLIRYLDDAGAQPGKFVSGAVAGLFLASQVAIAGAVQLVGGAEKLWGAAPLWWLYALLSAAAIYLFARKRVLLATAAFVIVTVASSVTVNPVYVGVFDLRETPASHAIVHLNRAHPGQWLGIGDSLVTATLLESGVTAYNGTQGAPSKKMWKQIDPTGKYDYAWNRIGGVIWEPGKGNPVVSNPAPDQIQVTFDACSSFAQTHVAYVLSNKAVNDPCLTPTTSFATQGSPLTIYRVAKP